MKRWSDKAWEAALPVYRKILEHPFVGELSAGTLSPERFRFYIRQDALYLDGYARRLAHIASRLARKEHPEAFLRFALDGVEVERALHEQFLGGGIVDETQSDTAFFRCIVDNLLRAYLSKRAARDTHGNAFQQGRLAGPVRLLGLIVPVIAENQCRHALPQHVGQRTEGAEIFGFYRL